MGFMTKTKTINKTLQNIQLNEDLLSKARQTRLFPEFEDRNTTKRCNKKKINE